MKRFRKYVGLVMALVMVMLVMSPMAQANSIIGEMTTEQMLLPSPNAIYSAYGVNIPQNLRTELTALDVQVNNASMVEIIPFNGTSNIENALVVTNKSGGTVVKDTFVMPEENGQFGNFMPVDENAASVMAGSGAWIPVQFSSLVRATIVYNVYYDPSDWLQGYPYHQPQSVYFVYYNNGTDSVSHVLIHYICAGFAHTYPGIVDISDGEVEEHTISVVKNNPSYNTVYGSYSNPYRSDQILKTWGEEVLNPGQFIVYYIVVNGQSYERTIELTQADRNLDD